MSQRSLAIHCGEVWSTQVGTSAKDKCTSAYSCHRLFLWNYECGHLPTMNISQATQIFTVVIYWHYDPVQDDMLVQLYWSILLCWEQFIYQLLCCWSMILYKANSLSWNGSPMSSSFSVVSQSIPSCPVHVLQSFPVGLYLPGSSLPWYN